MRHLRFRQTLLGATLWSLLVYAGAAWSQAPPGEEPAVTAQGEDLPVSVPDLELREGQPGARDSRLPEVVDAESESPAMACYRAARERGRDAYVCDLAVQIARDGASREALTAAIINRALVLARDGRLEPALSDLDEALTQAPGDPALHGHRGNLLLRLNRPAEALAAYNRAIDLAPDDPAGYYNRAFAYRALGDPVRAEEEVRAARSLLARRRLPVTGAETPAGGGDRRR